MPGPGLIPVRAIVCRPALTPNETSLSGSKVGGSLTETTVMRKEFVSESIPPFAVPPLSANITVIVAVPN